MAKQWCRIVPHFIGRSSLFLTPTFPLDNVNKVTTHAAGWRGNRLWMVALQAAKRYHARHNVAAEPLNPHNPAPYPLDMQWVARNGSLTPPKESWPKRWFPCTCHTARIVQSHGPESRQAQQCPVNI